MLLPAFYAARILWTAWAAERRQKQAVGRHAGWQGENDASKPQEVPPTPAPRVEQMDNPLAVDVARAVEELDENHVALFEL